MLKSKFIIISLSFFLAYLVACSPQRDEKVQFFGMYSSTDIEVKKDIQTYGFGSTLLIRRDGNLRFPVGVIKEFEDTTAVGSIEFQDSNYMLNVDAADSTLDGRWIFEELETETSNNGDVFPRSFRMTNDYYSISYTLLIRVDEL